MDLIETKERVTGQELAKKGPRGNELRNDLGPSPYEKLKREDLGRWGYDWKKRGFRVPRKWWTTLRWISQKVEKEEKRKD